MSRILLIEDEVNVSAFIKRGLEEQSHQVDVAYDGATGKSLALQKEYDVIILDVILPNANGWEVCKSIRSLHINTPILMLSALGTTEDTVKGLDLGADDYLTKPFKFNELTARIRALDRRRHTTQEPALALADLRVDTAAKKVTRAGRDISLTWREYKLLEYLIRNKGRVLSRIQLMENVWEVDFDLGTNVVEVYVNYLRNKIDKPFPTKLLHTVIGMGYVMKETGEA
ncbi:MAG: response regulator transcription factor [Cytophagales bacterium]|nr:response regulator transcription factor [Cytophagales bacterium]